MLPDRLHAGYISTKEKLFLFPSPDRKEHTALNPDEFGWLKQLQLYVMPSLLGESS